MRSIIVSLTMPSALLEQVDELARQEHETRSWIMRRAIRKYVEKTGLGRSGIKTLPAKPPRDLTETMKKHPQVNPNDIELLKFLDDYENSRL